MVTDVSVFTGFSQVPFLSTEYRYPLVLSEVLPPPTVNLTRDFLPILHCNYLFTFSKSHLLCRVSLCTSSILFSLVTLMTSRSGTRGGLDPDRVVIQMGLVGTPIRE